jgi:hypothetical protein
MTVRKEHRHSLNQAASLLYTRNLTFLDYSAWLIFCLGSPGLLWFEESGEAGVSSEKVLCDGL